MLEQGLDLLDCQNGWSFGAFAALPDGCNGIAVGPFPTDGVTVEGTHDVSNLGPAALG